MKTIHSRLMRLLSAGLAALLLMGLLPMAALAADTPKEIGKAADLVTAVSTPEGNKNIRLTDSIELDAPLFVTGGVTIDLDGHTISAKFTEETVKAEHKMLVDELGQVKDDRFRLATFIVGDGSTLTLTGKADSTVSAPTFAEGASGGPVYGLYVVSTGALTVKGSVQITGSNAEALICLCRSADLTLADNVVINGGKAGISTQDHVTQYFLTAADASKPSSITIVPKDVITIGSGSAIFTELNNRLAFKDMIDGGKYQVEADGTRLSSLETEPDQNVKSYVFRPKQALGTPASATLRSDFTAIWEKVAGADSYQLQLYRGGLALNAPISVSGSATSYDLREKLDGDGEYSFKVAAVSGGTPGPEAESNTVVRDMTAPGVTGMLLGRSSEKSATVRFTLTDEFTREIGYWYLVSTSSSVKAEVIMSTGRRASAASSVETTMNIDGLTGAGVQYMYIVAQDGKENTSEPFRITISAFTPTAAPTEKATTAPTATPTPAPTTYNVTLNGGTGYSVAATGGSSSPVKAGGSFSFTVNIASGYTKGSGFAVKANGVTLAAYNNVYTISNINADQSVTVTGVVASQSGGYVAPTAVASIPSITTTVLPSASLGEEYKLQLAATGGGTISWSYTGSLPAGITISTAGLVSGTPTQEGTFRFTLKASNATGSANRQMTLVVTGEGYTVTQGASAEWIRGGKEGLVFASTGKSGFTVRIDGSAVPEKDLSFAADNSSVTLSPAYLDTLSVGSHTLTMVYADGSAKAKFSVKSQSQLVAPDITGQPQSAEVEEGDTVTFTVTSSGSTPLKCQWQMDANDGKGWTDIAGADSVSYSVKSATAEQNGWKYRCVVTNAKGSVESNAATLTIRGLATPAPDSDTDGQETGKGSGVGGIVLPIVLLGIAGGAGGGLYYYFRRRKFMDEDE